MNMNKFALFVCLLFFSVSCVETLQDNTLRESNLISHSHDEEDDIARPVANATLTEEDGVIVQTGTKTTSNKEWNVYRVTLGENGEVTVDFDGSSSYDPDHTNESDTGITTYEWKVLFDAPYGSEFDLQGHTFSYSTEDASTNESAGLWSYNFANVTVDSTGTNENQIRIELITYDAVGKFSEKFRMYFVVVPHNFIDNEPEFQFDMTLNGTMVTNDTIMLNGSLISGSETVEVYVEVAFFEEHFSASALEKYNLNVQNLWAKSEGLHDGDDFSLTLSVKDLYSNTSNSQRVYIKTYEGNPPDEKWVNLYWIEFTLAACQGLVAPYGAIEAGGEFILDENGACQWVGVWSYDSVTGEWVEPKPQHYATFSLDLPLDAEIIENDFFFINGTLLSSSHDETYIEVAFENISFNSSADDKNILFLNHLWNQSNSLSVQSNFSLQLGVESLRGNITMAHYVHVRAFVLDNESQKILTDEASFEIVVPYLDSDGDGVADDFDAFPSDSNETHDSDGDGVGNNSDAFPQNPNETMDTDGDAYGDNSDDCAEVAGNSTIDRIGCLDTDGDGWSNSNDSFIDDDKEWNDTDGDGVGDNSDAFPNDKSETKDTDGNGVGDNEQFEAEQFEVEQERKNATIVGVLIAVIGGIGGVLYFRMKVNSKSKPESQKLSTVESIDLNINQNGAIVHSSNEVAGATVLTQWTDNNGYTWRKMSDGSTHWWDGTVWNRYEN